MRELSLYESPPVRCPENIPHSTVSSETWSQYYRNVFRNYLDVSDVGRLPTVAGANVRNRLSLSTVEKAEPSSPFLGKLRRDLVYGGESHKSVPESSAPPRTAPRLGTLPRTSPPGVQRMTGSLVAPDRLLPLLVSSTPSLHAPALQVKSSQATGSDMVVGTAALWRHNQGVVARSSENSRARGCASVAAARGLGPVRRRELYPAAASGTDQSRLGQFKNSRGFADQAGSTAFRHQNSDDMGRDALRPMHPRAGVPLVCSPLNP